MTLTQRTVSTPKRPIEDLARLVACADPRQSVGHLAAALHETHDRIKDALVLARMRGFGWYDPSLVLPAEIAHDGSSEIELGEARE